MKICYTVPFLFQAHRNFPITDFMKIGCTVSFLFQTHRLNSRMTEQYYEALRSVPSRLVKAAVLLSALMFGLPEDLLLGLVYVYSSTDGCTCFCARVFRT